MAGAKHALPVGMRYPKRAPLSGGGSSHKSGWREVWCDVCKKVTKLSFLGVKVFRCRCGTEYPRGCRTGEALVVNDADFMGGNDRFTQARRIREVA